MPRRPHIWLPGITYHIEAKGNRNSRLFYDEKDYMHYLTLLFHMKTMDDFDLHAYSLLPNHIHLLIETFTVDVSTLMQRLQTSYAMYVNRRHQLSGHVFGRRYSSIPLEDEIHFFKTSHYIHRTPLEENLVDSISEYPWCSAQVYLSSHTNEIPECQPVSLERTLLPFPSPKEKYFHTFINHPMPFEFL